MSSLTRVQRAASGPGRQAGLRVGLVGAGLMGRWHAHAVARAGARLVGVGDQDGAAAEALAARRGARSFASVEELLSIARPDVLHICTPLSTHQELIALGVEAGVHVVAEKPLTNEAEATEALYERAAARRVSLTPVHQFVFQDGVRVAVRELGALGRPVHVQATFYSAGAGGGPEIETGGDRVVADILPHPLSVLEALWPGALANAEWTAARPAPGELRAHAMFKGATVSLTVSMSARPTRAEMWLAGTQGSLELDFFHGFALREKGTVSRLRKALRPFDTSARRAVAAARNLGHRALVGAPAYPGLNEFIAAVYESIEGSGPPPIPAEAAIAVARARDRILAAAGLRRARATAPIRCSQDIRQLAGGSGT